MTCTSVPGPQEKVTIAGSEVKSCLFFVNHLHPVLSIFSYNGQVHMNLTADETSMSNAHLVPTFYMNALVLLGNALEIDVPKSVLEYANVPSLVKKETN